MRNVSISSVGRILTCIRVYAALLVYLKKCLTMLGDWLWREVLPWSRQQPLPDFVGCESLRVGRLEGVIGWAREVGGRMGSRNGGE
jgi:hypothetical protein